MKRTIAAIALAGTCLVASANEPFPTVEVERLTTMALQFPPNTPPHSAALGYIMGVLNSVQFSGYACPGRLNFNETVRAILSRLLKVEERDPKMNAAGAIERAAREEFPCV